jgi:hypothetical protein
VVCLRFDLVQRFESAFDVGDDVFGGDFPDESCGCVIPMFGRGGDRSTLCTLGDRHPTRRR